MLYSKEEISQFTKEALSRLSPNIPIQRISADTDIEADLVWQVLAQLSLKLGLKIPLARVIPHRGWKVSTVVGYVFHNQVSFELLDENEENVER